MRNHPIIWSAAACEFPGAGVYIGLGQDFEHLAIARGLNPRQMRMFAGGRMQAPDGVSFWSLAYYAIRDPSALRVAPVEGGAAPPIRRHVRLHFRMDAAHVDSIVVHRPNSTQAGAPIGFLISVGLAMPLEDHFYAATVDHEQSPSWGDLFSHVASAARTVRLERNPKANRT